MGLINDSALTGNKCDIMPLQRKILMGEAKLLSMVNHPNIIRCLQVEHAPGQQVNLIQSLVKLCVDIGLYWEIWKHGHGDNCAMRAWPIAICCFYALHKTLLLLCTS